MKERWEARANKNNRIEWTVSKDDRTKKAVFYVISPEYHAHPWTACAAMITPDEKLISTYAFMMDAEQADAQLKALKMARDWITGKRLAGRKIVLQ